MDNVYDIMHENELVNIVPEDTRENDISDEILSATAVAVNLYYEDTLKQYFKYLDNIPKQIDIFIMCSNANAWEEIEQYASNRGNVIFCKKENRGRDVSALLVAFRKIALTKKYICFVHDKKEISEYLKKDTEYWVQCLWDNTLKTENFICNIISLMERNNNIGILVPPKPLGEYLPYWYVDSWGRDFEITKDLAERMQLKCDLDPQKPVIACGTAFWCKTDALRKLLNIEWKYSDFPQEPLPADGTISHAIERILPYISQDAGYTAEIVMCKSYAKSLLLKAQKQMEETYRMLSKNFQINSFYQLRWFDKTRTMAKEIFSNYKHIYLYGAGKEGRKLLNYLYQWGYTPDGFVVSNGKREIKKIRGIFVYELSELVKDEDMAIIITVGESLQKEIEEQLKYRGFSNNFKINNLNGIIIADA